MSSVSPGTAVHADPMTRAQPAPASDDRAAWPYLIIAAVTVIAWRIATGVDYQAGAGIGYAFGLVGGSALLLLLLYPVAKRVEVLRRWLALKHWFRGHMLLGVAGAVLILLHSRLSLGSINGAVAFWALSVVFVSGLFGRFVYTKIHRGLYGRRLNLDEVKQRLGINEDNVRSKFHFHPPLEQYLMTFERQLLATSAGAGRLFSAGPRVRWAHFQACRQLKAALSRQAAVRHWDAAKQRRAYRHGERIIAAYLSTIKDVALFNAYERVFSAWHLLHIPLMVILVVTGVIHVIAVHMY